MQLSNGRISASIGILAHTLWNDRHPVIMIFFILLLSVSECLFIPPAWNLMSTSRKAKAGILVTLPYVFLYLAASRDPGYITTANHSHEMALYPYDYTVFHPGKTCSTCHFLKPARSKHCSICKRCISKYDHHCVFINNCVGYKNQHFFLLLLFTTGLLTTYATYIGISLLSSLIKQQIPYWTLRGSHFSWSQYFHVLGWALQENTRIGTVTLLCLLTTPLVWGLLIYHFYLIWAGTTTNESLKWSDWEAEMSDGYVFKRALPEDREKNLDIEPAWTRWPCESQQIVLRTLDSMPPIGDLAIGVGVWERVWRLADVENLYDMGFWDNLKDVFWPRYGLYRGQRENVSLQQGTRSRPSSSIGDLAATPAAS